MRFSTFFKYILYMQTNLVNTHILTPYPHSLSSSSKSTVSSIKLWLQFYFGVIGIVHKSSLIHCCHKIICRLGLIGSASRSSTLHRPSYPLYIYWRPNCTMQYLFCDFVKTNCFSCLITLIKMLRSWQSDCAIKEVQATFPPPQPIITLYAWSIERYRVRRRSSVLM